MSIIRTIILIFSTGRLLMSDSILIVDDDSELAQITSDMLKSYGYNVTIAGDSTMAFDLLVEIGRASCRERV